MAGSNSITRVVSKMQAGDDEAARQLFELCYADLVMHAEKHLQGVSKGMSDAEDIALSAVKSFVIAARKGRFPRLDSRDDLWRLLLAMTRRKAVDLRRYENRRDPGKLRSDGGLADFEDDISPEEFGVMVAELLEDRLGKLNPELCRFAVAKLEGYSNLEIAAMFQVSPRTAERKLELIRMLWRESEAE